MLKVFYKLASSSLPLKGRCSLCRTLTLKTNSQKAKKIRRDKKNGVKILFLCAQKSSPQRWSNLLSHPPPPPRDRAKLEKERKEKSRQLGLIRTEGSDGGEDMERERRTFQLQMCEVGGLVPVKIPAPDTFHIPEVGSVQPARVVFLGGDSIFLSVVNCAGPGARQSRGG